LDDRADQAGGGEERDVGEAKASVTPPDRALEEATRTGWHGGGHGYDGGKGGEGGGHRGRSRVAAAAELSAIPYRAVALRWAVGGSDVSGGGRRCKEKNRVSGELKTLW